jgi:acetate CoA/acetoacetate CoA-transferase beta subunit
MDPQTIIAKRIARELRAGMLVNLGIGIPTLVANYVPPDLRVFFQSENGLIGTGPVPEEGMAHPTLTDAGGAQLQLFQVRARSTAPSRLASFEVGTSM